MSNLGSQQINATFGYLLQIPGGLTSSLVTVQDGSGNNLPISISTTGATGTFTGGTINGMVIGGVNPQAGTFTTLGGTTITASIQFTGPGTGLTGTASSLSVGGSAGSVSGPVAATTLSASGVVSGVGFSNYLASPPAIGSGTANTGAFTTLSASSTVTLSGGTANGVLYLNGSKAVTSGTALVFDGTNFSTTGSATATALIPSGSSVPTNGLFLPAANSVGFSTNTAERMRIDSSGNVGIGTSTPTSKLSVLGGSLPIATSGYGVSISSSLSATRLTTDASNLTGFIGGYYDNSALEISQGSTSGYVSGIVIGARSATNATVSNAVAFYTQSTERMRIDSSGNVGIGTSSPSTYVSGQGLSIQTLGGATNGLSVYSPSTVNGAKINLADNNYSAYITTVPSGAATSLAFGVSGAERMRIDASGNLGLGVTPSAWASGYNALQIATAGVSLFSDDAQSAWFGTNFYANASGAFKYLSSTYAGTYRIQRGTGQHQWYTAPSGTAGNAITFTQAMTLDASGNLLVGGTATVAGAKLYSVQTTNTSLSAYFANTGTGNCYGIGSSINGASNTSSFHFQGVTQGVNTWYLYGNGTTSYSSDERLKKNIQTARDGYLEDLNKLRVVKYQWDTDNELAQQTEIGLIAQEVEQVFPGLVQDALHESPDGNTYKVIKHSVMEFILIKAIQELSAKVAELESKLN